MRQNLTSTDVLCLLACRAAFICLYFILNNIVTGAWPVLSTISHNKSFILCIAYKNRTAITHDETSQANYISMMSCDLIQIIST